MFSDGIKGPGSNCTDRTLRFQRGICIGCALEGQLTLWALAHDVSAIRTVMLEGPRGYKKVPADLFSTRCCGNLSLLQTRCLRVVQLVRGHSQNCIHPLRLMQVSPGSPMPHLTVRYHPCTFASTFVSFSLLVHGAADRTDHKERMPHARHKDTSMLVIGLLQRYQRAVSATPVWSMP